MWIGVFKTICQLLLLLSHSLDARLYIKKSNDNRGQEGKCNSPPWIAQATGPKTSTAIFQGQLVLPWQSGWMFGWLDAKALFNFKASRRVLGLSWIYRLYYCVKWMNEFWFYRMQELFRRWVLESIDVLHHLYCKSNMLLSAFFLIHSCHVHKSFIPAGKTKANLWFCFNEGLRRRVKFSSWHVWSVFLIKTHLFNCTCLFLTVASFSSSSKTEWWHIYTK